MRPAKFFALMQLDKERSAWSALKKHEFYRAYCALELQLRRLESELNCSHREALRKLAKATFFDSSSL